MPLMSQVADWPFGSVWTICNMKVAVNSPTPSPLLVQCALNVSVPFSVAPLSAVSFHDPDAASVMPPVHLVFADPPQPHRSTPIAASTTIRRFCITSSYHRFVLQKRYTPPT